MKFYIYKITNKINGKCYIGKHKTFKGETLRNYMGSGIALVEAQRKYGIENFDKEIIEEIEDDEKQLIIDERERFWIKTLNTISPNGYNISYGGEGGCYHLSEETKMKISKSNLGKPKSKEHIKNMRIAEFSKTYTFEYENGETETRTLILCDYCKENNINYDNLKYLSKIGFYCNGLRIKEFYDETEIIRKMDRTCKCFINPITNEYVSYWTLNQLKHRYHKPELENVEIMNLLDKSKMIINPCRWWNNGKEEHFCKEPPDETFKLGRIRKKFRKTEEYKQIKKDLEIERLKKMKRVKGKSHYYNNGIINVIDQKCPIGFVNGRIKNW